MIKHFLAIPALIAAMISTSYSAGAPVFSVHTGQVIKAHGVEGVLYTDLDGGKKLVKMPVKEFAHEATVEFIKDDGKLLILSSAPQVPLKPNLQNDAQLAAALQEQEFGGVQVAPKLDPKIEDEEKVVLSDIYHATLPQDQLYSLVKMSMSKEVVLTALQVKPTSLKGLNKRAFINEFCAQWQGKHAVDYGRLDSDSRILALMILVDDQNLHRTGSELFFDALTFNDEGNRFLTPTNLSALGYNDWNGRWMNKKKNGRHPGRFGSLMAASPNSGRSGTL